MEQKTEASQAVAYSPEFVKYVTSSRSVIPAGLEWSHQTVRHAWEVWQASRAALKAQPAPTEAEQGEQIGWVNTKYGNLIPLSGLASTKRNSELLASRELIAVYGAGQLSGNSGELQPSGNTGELAQGEDSARLEVKTNIDSKLTVTENGILMMNFDIRLASGMGTVLEAMKAWVNKRFDDEIEKSLMTKSEWEKSHTWGHTQPQEQS